MSEHPILFSGPMVRAILEGRKTMTRRVVKGVALEWLATGMFTPAYVAHPDNHLCPYGQPGDRLWVRETWRIPGGAPNGWTDYKADDDREGFKWRPSIHMPRLACRILLDVTAVRVERVQDIKQRDAMHEGIEPEPVEVSGSQVVFPRGKVPQDARLVGSDYKAGFHKYWDSLNAKRGNGWDANPWVWVVEFKRVAP